MINSQTLTGNWNDIKGKLRKKWGELTNDDLQVFNGNVDQLIGMIQQKTGEVRGNVERFLEDVTSNGAAGISQAAETVKNYAAGAATQARDYVGQTADAVERGSQQAYDAARRGYVEAEESVRRRPAESVALSFGAGVVIGLLLALTFRSE